MQMILYCVDASIDINPILGSLSKSGFVKDEGVYPNLSYRKHHTHDWGVAVCPSAKFVASLISPAMKDYRVLFDFYNTKKDWIDTVNLLQANHNQMSFIDYRIPNDWEYVFKRAFGFKLKYSLNSKDPILDEKIDYFSITKDICGGQ